MCNALSLIFFYHKPFLTPYLLRQLQGSHDLTKATGVISTLILSPPLPFLPPLSPSLPPSLSSLPFLPPYLLRQLQRLHHLAEATRRVISTFVLLDQCYLSSRGLGGEVGLFFGVGFSPLLVVGEAWREGREGGRDKYTLCFFTRAFSELRLGRRGWLVSWYRLFSFSCCRPL